MIRRIGQAGVALAMGVCAARGFAQEVNPIGRAPLVRPTTTRVPDPEPFSVPSETIDRLMKDPPPISLHLDSVPFDDMATALGAALDAEHPSIHVLAASRAPATLRYTLDMTNQPFWEVVKALHEQAPFSFSSNTEGSRLASVSLTAGGTALRHFERSGPVVVYVESFKVVRSSNAQDRVRATIRFGSIVDPRLKLIQHELTLTGMKDQAGHDMPLDAKTAGDTPGFASAANARIREYSWALGEPYPKSITLSCEVRVMAQFGFARVAVENPDQHVGEAIKVGDKTMKLTDFSMAGNRLNLRISAGDAPTSVYSATLTDSTNREVNVSSVAFGEVAAGNVPGRGGAAAGVQVGGQGPFRLVIKGPDAYRASVYKVDVRDVPLP